MNLDIETERGQKTLADEQIIAEWLKLKKTDYLQTPKNLPADVDAIIAQNGELKAVVETKCRYNLTLEKLQTAFNNEWLLTEEKISKGTKVAHALRVKLYGFLYLVNDDTLLIINLNTAPRRCERTYTQATVNGGIAKRLNAYVNLASANIHYGIKKKLEEYRERENLHRPFGGHLQPRPLNDGFGARSDDWR